MREGDLTGRRVLEVGCGTGRFLAALDGRAKAWGVDPSPEMLEVARGRVQGAGLKLGSAEELPFKDGWFERAVMWLVVHLVDRPRAFAELHRVLSPGGRLAIATFDPVHFDAFWLNALFPSLEAIDRARFPTAQAAGGRARCRRLRRRAADPTLAGELDRPRGALSRASAASTSRPSTCSTTTSTPPVSKGPSASSRSASSTGSSGCWSPPSGVPCKVTNRSAPL